MYRYLIWLTKWLNFGKLNVGIDDIKKNKIEKQCNATNMLLLYELSSYFHSKKRMDYALYKDVVKRLIIFKGFIKEQIKHHFNLARGWRENIISSI